MLSIEKGEFQLVVDRTPNESESYMMNMLKYNSPRVTQPPIKHTVTNKHLNTFAQTSYKHNSHNGIFRTLLTTVIQAFRDKTGIRAVHRWHKGGISLAQGRYIAGTRAVHRWHKGGTSLAQGRYIPGTRAVHRWHKGGTSLAQGRYIA